MPYFAGPIYQTTNPAVGRLLEDAITALIKEWRREGHFNHPDRPLALHIQSDLHELAISETPKETLETLVAGPRVSQVDRSDWLTTYEAAERLKVSVQMVRRYCEDERLTSTRPGKSIRIDPRSIDALRAEKDRKSA